jgi:PAS domain S-box-containing protein
LQHTILDNVAYGIISTTPEGIITSLNPAAGRLLGYTADEIVGKQTPALWHDPKEIARYARQLSEELGETIPPGFEVFGARPQRNLPEENEWTFICKDGRRIPVNLSVTALRDEEGRITGFVGLGHDLTERKQAEVAQQESEAFLNSLLDAIPIPVFYKDKTGRYLGFNRAYETFFGATKDSLIGKTAFDISPPELAEAYYAKDRELFEGEGAQQYESRVKNSLGVVRDVIFSKAVFTDRQGAIIGLIGAILDITERKLAEEEVRKLNQELELRVADRTEQLESANDELEAFSYSVSHDLRTPLRAIDGFSKILLDGYTDKLDDEGKRLLNVVRDNTGRMGQLIDDMLKFSRTGRVEIYFSEIDMEKLARGIFDELKTAVADNKLQMEIEHLPPVRGDSAMMRQVFVNLLANAIKFSRPKETPRIHVGASVKDNETIYYVQDNGAGFDMQFADKLFGVFQRLHSSTEFEGTGIGLAIVKRIVTRHAGRVWAEGKINEGATFYFALPTREKSHE